MLRLALSVEDEFDVIFYSTLLGPQFGTINSNPLGSIDSTKL